MLLFGGVVPGAKPGVLVLGVASASLMTTIGAAAGAVGG
jgi:hypothetical protein